MAIAVAPDTAQHARTFAQPPLVRWLGLSAAAFCTACCVLVLGIPALRPHDDSRLLVVSCLAVFGACLYLCFAMVRSSRDEIVVADDGLWCRSPGRPAVCIPWGEIGQVQAQNVMQRLVVTDKAGTRSIHLEFHMQDFGELKRIVLERSAAHSALD